YVEAPVSEDLATRLASVPGVAAVVGSRVIDWPLDGRRVAIEALDARYFTDSHFGRWPLARQQIADVWERVARGEAAIVSASFLANFGRRIGERVLLSTPTGPLELVIGGATAAFESPAGTIQMSREGFARDWGGRQGERGPPLPARGGGGAAPAGVRRDRR